jgi:DNA-binding NtrC family response regulator
MKKALVIDQYDCVREVLQEELEDEGFNVIGKKDVSAIQEAISFFKPDLVVLDFYIDKHERWDVLQNIKRNNPYLPVIIYTGYCGYARDPRMALADGFVIKSAIFDGIKRTIAAVADRRSSSPEGMEHVERYPAQAPGHDNIELPRLPCPLVE